jgi:hypothetical protein
MCASSTPMKSHAFPVPAARRCREQQRAAENVQDAQHLLAREEPVRDHAQDERARESQRSARCVYALPISVPLKPFDPFM